MSAATFDGTWNLSPADRLLIEAKRWGSRLRFAVMLLFLHARGRFPRSVGEFGEDTMTELARTLGLPALDSAASLLPKTLDRTLERQRAEIRASPARLPRGHRRRRRGDGSVAVGQRHRRYP